MSRSHCLSVSVLVGVLALNGCGSGESSGWSGYVEGEETHVAAPVAGRLIEVKVRKGESVVKGVPFFRLENGAENALVAELAAREQGAKAQARDVTKGQRLPELRATEAQLQQARVRLQQANEELSRQHKLAQDGYALKARLEESALAVKEAQARVDELEARLQIAKLPAREDVRESAASVAAAAGFGRSQSDWRIQQLQQFAPKAGVVTEVFYRVGEWVEAGRPVLSLLPAEARKARFFVPQQALAQVPIGAKVSLTCDGCGADIAAQVTYVAAEPEFTPPVIYSNAQRSKLVFMAEAAVVRADDSQRLRPGQPLVVRISGTP